MDYWLGQFQERRLIKLDSDRIGVVRTPTADEVDAARAPPDTLFS